MLDLSDPLDLSRSGLAGQDLAADDHTACQEVGAAVDWLGHDGLLVPSARSDALSLVIYPANRSPDAVFAFGAGEAVS